MMNGDLLNRLREYGVIAGPDHFVVGDGYGNPDRHTSLFVDEHVLNEEKHLRQELLYRLWEKIENIEFDGIIAANPQSLVTVQGLAGLIMLERGLDKLAVTLFDRDKVSLMPARTLIHDDVVNNGRMIDEIIFHLQDSGLDPQAVTSLFTRVETHELSGLPILTVVERLLPSYPLNQCPFCKRRVPVNTHHGKGAPFVQSLSRLKAVQIVRR